VNVDAIASSPVRRRLTRAGLGTDRVIAVSQALAAKLRQIGVPAARIRTVPSGVDPGAFTPADPAARLAARDRLELPRDRFLFLAMNLFDPVKGHRILIDAFAELVRGRPQAAFLAMTGDGPERPAIEARARELGLGAEIRFAGLRPYSELPHWLRAADALVLPSLSEGMPLTVLEGFAAGKPTVGSAVGGLPELVPDRRFGLLVPPGDPVALGRALAEAIDEPWDPVAIRRWGMEFAWPAVVARVRGVYSELLP
jgi:glycosyltransferase involved in cell wall biosynthesis